MKYRSKKCPLIWGSVIYNNGIWWGMLRMGMWIISILYVFASGTTGYAEQIGQERQIAITSDYQLTLEGTLQFVEKPMSAITSIRPSFWFRDETTGSEYSDAVATYDSTNGTYTFSNLPSRKIGISIVFHTTGSESTLPGNYRTWITVNPSLLTQSERKNFDIDLQEIIHLTEPWDNSKATSSLSDPYPVHSSPLTFSWDAVSQATYYHIVIYRYRDPDHPDEYGFLGISKDEKVGSTSYSASLEENNAQEHYEFTLNAYTNTVGVGYFMATYTNGYGWDYRFKIKKDVKVNDEDKEFSQLPTSYQLFQNYPNPFNPSTDIRYQIADVRSPLHTTLKVYNILGQEVRTLVDEVQGPGYYTVTWDGRGSNGTHVASGMYLYQLNAGDYTSSRYMVLLK